MDDEKHLNWGNTEFEEIFEEWNKETSIDKDEKTIDMFFEHFFLCIEGHGKLIDACHSGRNLPYCSTRKNDKMRFNDEEADDPD